VSSVNPASFCSESHLFSTDCFGLAECGGAQSSGTHIQLSIQIGSITNSKTTTSAAQYLTQAAQDLEPVVFIAALRHVVDLRGGLAKVADVGSLSKASLHKAIPHSGQGNPTARTMFAALRASALNLTFSAASPLQ
jgi:DNA-binding phage protein